MATVTFTRNSPSRYGNVYIDVAVNYSESYDADTNRTTVSITSVQIRNRSYTIGTKVIKGSVKINGSVVASFSPGESAGAQANVGTSYATISGGSLSSAVVAHNADGTGSFSLTLDQAVSATVSYTGIFGYLDSASGNTWKVGIATPNSQTVQLTPRPRGSTISSSTSAVATNGTYSLVMDKKDASYHHIATFSYNGDTLYTSDAFDTSLSFTVPRSWFADYASLATIPVTVSVQTYNSSDTAIGNPATASFTVNADAEMKPSVSAGWAALAPYNTGAVSGITGYVKGYSQAEATFDSTKIDMTNAVGASIASYSVTCQGATVSASPYRTPVLAATSVEAICTVTDTRGRTASESITLTVMDYVLPVMTGQTIFRCDSLGTADEDGTYLSVKATLTVSSLDSQNVGTLTVAVAAAGGSYGSETSMTSGTASVIGPYSPDQSYNVRISAADSLGNTAVYYEAIPTRKWAMKFRANGRGVAFGKAPETDDVFEIADGWAVKSRGIVDLIYPVGSIYFSVNSTNPGTLFGGTWQQLEDRFLLGAGTTYTAGDTGGEAAHTLTKDELPNEKLDIQISNNWLGYKNTTASAGSGIAGLGYMDGTALKTSSMGSGNAHNNMPPYLVVYMWERTA